jgi:hypothetical protein
MITGASEIPAVASSSHKEYFLKHTTNRAWIKKGRAQANLYQNLNMLAGVSESNRPVVSWSKPDN